MGQPPASTEDRYAAIGEALLGTAGVSLGTPGKRGFGQSALQVGGKIFAMLSQGTLVVKLPRQRVDAIVAAGHGARFDPGHGRLMKEWVAIGPDCTEDWLSLAREAMGFVDATR